MRFNRKVTFIVGLVTPNGTPLDRDAVLHDVAEVLKGQNIEGYTGCGIDGFTVTDNTGYWQGQQEPSISVTVLCDPQSIAVIYTETLAKAMAAACLQECVLWSIESAVYAGLAYNH